MLDTSPPSSATSRTVLELRKAYAWLVIRQTTSMSGASCLLVKRHVPFQFEVADDAQPAHDDLRADLPRILDGEAAVARDFDVGQIAQRLLGQLQPFVDVEQQVLQRPIVHGDDHAIENAGRAFGDVDVAVSEWDRMKRDRWRWSSASPWKGVSEMQCTEL